LQDDPARLRIPERYTTPAIALHWAIAVLMVINILLGWSFSYIQPGSLRPFIEMHKSFGITVLGLGLMRLLWRLTHTPPALPAAYKPWERRAAHAAHWILYGLVFLVPLSGWAHDSAWKLAATHPMKLFFVIPWFRFGFLESLDPVTKEYWHTVLSQVHTSFAYVLAAMFVVHVAGALKHQFFEGVPELQRMWPGRAR
jgi:cytochrome b561